MLSPEPKPISTTSPASPSQTRRRSGPTVFVPQATFTIRGTTRSLYRPMSVSSTRHDARSMVLKDQVFAGRVPAVMRCSPHLWPGVPAGGPLLCGFEVAHQTVLSGEQRRGGTAGDPELGVDVLDVVRRCLRGHHQPLSDLFVGMAAGQQA